MSEARLAGTFYFIDICNSPEFSREISTKKEFRGIRFLELLGFSDPNDSRRMEMAEKAIKTDRQLHLAPHSLYGSSPQIFSFIKERESEIVSLHLLEEADETGLFQEKGKTYDFLCEIKQYKRHGEIFQNDPSGYLRRFLPGNLRTLLVHMTYADDSLIEMLEENFPLAAVVLCHRSNQNLGYARQNWQSLLKMRLPLLLGTDSCASSPDISVLHEVYEIISSGFLSESLIWRAATTNAYRYFNIREVPLFLFKGSLPDIQSLVKTHAFKLDMVMDANVP